MGYEIEMEKKEKKTFKKKERILMKNTIKIMVATLVLVLVTSMTTATAADAAKKKTYTTKTVKVTSGKSKTVTTAKKIKKVAISSTNKNFTVKKTGNYKFKVSGTDKGKSQTVKVTYTNKYTQKFKIKTVKAKKKTTKKIPSYAQKIVNELKPLLADPDKGLQTVLNDWTKRLNPRDGYTYEFKLANFKYQLGGSINSLTVDDIIKTYTASQKKALILEVYLRQRMHYSYACKSDYYYNRNSNAQFKKLYNGTFKGVCEDGAAMAYDICKYLGIKAYYTGAKSPNINHAWCGIYATDKNGTSYYHGIYTTSFPYSLKASVPAKYNNGGNMSETQLKKYLCSPNAATYFRALKTQVKNKPIRRPVPTTTPSVTTQAPVQTPAPQATSTPKPSPTTTTVIFNTPEPPEPDDTPTPVATTEPTKAPVVTQEPEKTPEPAKTPIPTTPAPIVTPEPTPEPTVEPTPVPQRIMIPHAEHNYTCPGCNVPYRHKNAKNPYITNGSATSGNITVYKHSTSEGIRYFDAEGNEYIDINKNGNIMDELALLQG